MNVWTIVVAAGSGSRFGGLKHLSELNGVRVIDRSLSQALASSDGVVLVVAGDQVAAMVAATVEFGFAPLQVVPGGDTRSASVRCGLAAVPATAEIVLVHDGARPLATAGLYLRVIDAVQQGASAVVPGVPVVDTIRRVDAGGGPVDRSSLVAVQTPQGFRASSLRAAHATGDEATDDAGLVEAGGEPVVVVDGERTNLKITNPEDLAMAAVLLEQLEQESAIS